MTVLSKTPPTKPYCEEAHRWGIKVCPYISLYKVFDSSKEADDDPVTRRFAVLGGGRCLEASRVFLRREDGKIRRPFDMPNYPTYNEQSCCNHGA